MTEPESNTYQQATLDAKRDNPSEEFYEYYERSSKKSDLIELIWQLMTEKQRAEILNEILAEQEDDEEDECEVCGTKNNLTVELYGSLSMCVCSEHK
jgi:hypothetical protein